MYNVGGTNNSYVSFALLHAEKNVSHLHISLDLFDGSNRQRIGLGQTYLTAGVEKMQTHSIIVTRRRRDNQSPSIPNAVSVGVYPRH